MPKIVLKRKYARREITNEEASALLRKHAPHWREHLRDVRSAAAHYVSVEGCGHPWPVVLLHTTI